MAFSAELIKSVLAVARKNGVEAAALMAVVEVETSGDYFEKDGVTPRFLFERHVFYRELKKRAPGKLQAAIRAGLAIPKWSRSTQYKDQGNSAGRLRVLASARAIDDECANRSCSWGIGQTMGFLAEELGFSSANALISHMQRNGLSGQLDCMVRFIRKKGLISKLNNHDWAGFARTYNGAGYRQNQYDTRMANAYVRWRSKLRTPQPDEEPEDVPLPRPPVQNGEPETPPIQSKTIWASIIGIIVESFAAIVAWLSGIPSEVWIAMIVAFTILTALFAFIIRERLKLIAEKWV